MGDLLLILLPVILQGFNWAKPNISKQYMNYEIKGISFLRIHEILIKQTCIGGVRIQIVITALSWSSVQISGDTGHCGALSTTSHLGLFRNISVQWNKYLRSGCLVRDWRWGITREDPLKYPLWTVMSALSAQPYSSWHNACKTVYKTYKLQPRWRTFHLH